MTDIERRVQGTIMTDVERRKRAVVAHLHALAASDVLLTITCTRNAIRARDAGPPGLAEHFERVVEYRVTMATFHSDCAESAERLIGDGVFPGDPRVECRQHVPAEDGKRCRVCGIVINAPYDFP